ncbi:MAG TPA: terminase small subunit [Hyphomicrobiaceae bacterium]|jgi:hypothetical protein
MVDSKPLTPKQQAFAELYVRTGNASAAYREVYSAEGSNESTVKKRASELLAHKMVKAHIAELRAKASEKAGLDAAYVLEALKENLEVSLGRRLIKLKERRRDRETGDISVEEIEVNAHDPQAANKAIDIAMRHLGQYEVDNLQQATATIADEVAPRQLARVVLDILRTANVAEAPSENSADDPIDDEPQIIEDEEVGGFRPPWPPASGDQLPVSEAGASVRAPAANLEPRPRPTQLLAGEREIIATNGAVIQHSVEFSPRHSVHDGLGRLAGWRQDLATARALAESLKPPPPPDEGRRNGRD